MSKFKKIGIILILGIMIILGYANNSEAATPTISTILNPANMEQRKNLKPAKNPNGSKVTITKSEWMNNNLKLYCAQRGQVIQNTPQEYNLSSRIVFKGANATGKYQNWPYNQITTTSALNAEVAYILKKSNGSGSGSKENGPVQQALWYVLPEWCGAWNGGDPFEGMYGGFGQNDDSSLETKKNWLVREAEAQAIKDLANAGKSEGGGIEDVLNIRTINVVEDGSYMRVGPFRWNFYSNTTGDKLSSLTVSNAENGQILNDVQFKQYGKIVKANQIVPNIDFYIEIPKSRGIIKKIHVKAEIKYQNEQVILEAWEPKDPAYQTMITTYTNIENKSAYLDKDYEIPTSEIVITKVDDENNLQPLNGVEFIVQYQDGKYLLEDGTFTDSKEKAYRYTTKGLGKVTVSNITRPGKYTIYEVKNPNLGYKNVDINNPIKMGDVTFNKIGGIEKVKTPTYENRQLYKIDVTKVDEESKVPMAGIGFVVKYKDQYVKANPDNEKNEATYVNSIDEATVYYTSVIGYRRVGGLLYEGTYEVLEVKNPYHGYKNVSKENPIKLGEVNAQNPGSTTLKVEATNRQLYKIDIEKVDEEDQNHKLAGVGFVVKYGEQYVKANSKNVPGLPQDEVTYVDSIKDATVYFTGLDGKARVGGLLKEGTYEIWEVFNPNPGYRDVSKENPLKIGEAEAKNPGSTTLTGETKRDGKVVAPGKCVNRQLYKIDISKRDTDCETKFLPGVKFVVKYGDQYIQRNIIKENQVKYVDNILEATEYEADKDGYLRIGGLLYEGDYEIWEVYNPNFGYEIVSKANPMYVGTATAKGLPTLIKPNPEDGKVTEDGTVLNKRKYIRLSGYVWEDIIFGKNSERNDLYMDGEYDTEDKRLKSVTVILRNKFGDELDRQVTNDDGEYSMGDYMPWDSAAIDLSVKKIHIYDDPETKIYDGIDGAYMDFVYNGMCYKSVPLHLDKDNGSKATDDPLREEFNNKYATITHDIGNDLIEKLPLDTDNAYSTDKIRSNTIFYEPIKEEHKSKVNYGKWLGYGEKYGYEGQRYPIAGVDKQYEITATTDGVSDNLLASKYADIDAFLKTGEEGIDYINLGVAEREMPDTALVKDLQNVRLAINGYEHTYQYASRFENQGEYGDGFNVGVKFGNEYGKQKYTRAIYKSDYTFVNDKDKSKELKAYVTYQIALRNESTSIVTRVNSVVDYFDKRYEGILDGAFEDSLTDGLARIQAGTELDPDRGIIKLDSRLPIIGLGTEGDYRKILIQTNMELQPQTTKSIYVRFELSRDQIADILKDSTDESGPAGEVLDNVVEINSYSSFDAEGNIYAGIDKDSNNGSAVPGDRDTYEDDTDAAPALQLEITKPRKMTGTVFLDKTRDEFKEYEVRLGNGIFDTTTEKGVSGVKVLLEETSGTDKVYDTAQEDTDKYTTDRDGNFEISGFIPGKYKLTYTWENGKCSVENLNEKITVQDYKGTIVNPVVYVNKGLPENKMINDMKDLNGDTILKYWNNIWSSIVDGVKAKQWYKDEFKQNNAEWANGHEIRVSDAIDNFETRKLIDSEGQHIDIKQEANAQYTTMDASTPQMGVGIELTSTGGDIVEYVISNIDYGIVERARQKVEMDKNVKTVKLTLANGQVVIDADLSTGNLDGVKYNPPSNANNGFVHLELDPELTQGATLQVGYKISAINKSEKEFTSKEYYLFGIPGGNTATVTPIGAVDYLDGEWSYASEDNKNRWDGNTWQEYNETQLKTKVYEEVWKSPGAKEAMILYTDDLQYDPDEDTKVKVALQLKESTSVMLNVSKLLTTTNEIVLDNQVELVEWEKTGGSRPEPPKDGAVIPGNYVPLENNNPNLKKVEPDDSPAESVIVSPDTGDNLAYIIPISIGIAALVVLGVGIVIIKKKVIGKK